MKTANEIQILFIDDITQIELDKIKIIKHLKEKINCEVEPLILHNKTLSDFIKNIDSLNNYHVILMDHKLNEMSDKNITGASLSGLIKDKWQSIPIIGVTNIDIENGITESKKNIYDALISKTELINNKYVIVDSIARSYRDLNNYFKNSNLKKDDGIKKEICKLLGAAEDDVKRINKIIPIEVIQSYKNLDFVSLLSKWIRKEFLEYPGFVYDSLWMATILGLKEESFIKIKDKFKDAIYRGPFCTEKELWWKTKVLKLVYQSANNDQDNPPFILKEKIKKINEKDFAHCANCNQLFPEIVGYKDDSMQKRVPLHIKCSLLTNKIPPKLFYDDVRIMEGE